MNQAVKRQHQNHPNQHGQPKKSRIYDDQNAELFIFPHYMYDKQFPDFKQPIELGNFISASTKIKK